MNEDMKLKGVLTELAAARRLVEAVGDYGASLAKAEKGPQLGDEAPLVELRWDEYQATIRTLDEIGVHVGDEELGVEDGERRTVELRAALAIPVADVGFSLEILAARRVIAALAPVYYEEQAEGGAELTSALAAFEALVSDLNKVGARYDAKEPAPVS